MQRLGLNKGAYFGQRLNPHELMSACRAAAERAGWSVAAFAPESLQRIALVRLSPHAEAPNFYLSAGIHGDEPAGLQAILELLQEDQWPLANYWIIPCLNPDGFSSNTRENSIGIDLNRDFRHPKSDEVIGQIAWLKQLPRLHLSLLLHEDWEANGFYCYELNSGNYPSLAQTMVNAVSPVCPIEHLPEVDGRPVDSPGIIRPSAEPHARPLWPEAVWLAVNKVDRNYTLEAPSDWPLSVRVEALKASVMAALEAATIDSL